MDYLAILEMLNKILSVIGNVTISEAKTWAETKANAEALRREGHENDLPGDNGENADGGS